MNILNSHLKTDQLGSEGIKPKQPTLKPIVEKKVEEKPSLSVAPQEDDTSKSPVPAGGSKKIVLFNPEMPIFKGGKDGNPLAETSSPEKKTKTPTFEEPAKKTESDKAPASKPTLFSGNPIDKLMEESKKLLSYINPKPAEPKEQGETVIFSQTKAFQSKEQTGLQKTTSSEPKTTQPVVEQKSNGPV